MFVVPAILGQYNQSYLSYLLQYTSSFNKLNRVKRVTYLLINDKRKSIYNLPTLQKCHMFIQNIHNYAFMFKHAAYVSVLKSIHRPVVLITDI